MFAHAISSTKPTAPSSKSIHELDARADDVVDKRPHADAAVLVPHRVRALDCGARLVHLRLRLRERYARLQTRDDLQIILTNFGIADLLVGGDDVRNPDVGARATPTG